MRIVVALGGNALLRRGEKPDASTQIRNVEIAAHELAKLAEKHELVLTHGNGPQVGVLALQSANDERLSEPYPFDTLGAQTQGMIGYWLLQAMQNALPGRHVAAMVNQTLVMAEALEADALLILTDVDGVFEDFGTENQKQVPRATPAELRAMGLPSGSMGPKVEAVCRFVELTGDMAAIGRLEDAVSIIDGHAGTIVTPGGNYGGPDDIHPPIPEQLDTRIRRA